MKQEKEIEGFNDLTDDNLWDIIDPNESDDILSVDIDEDEEQEESGKKKAPLLEDEEIEIPINDEEEEEDSDEESDDDSESEEEEDDDISDNPAKYFAKAYAEKGILTVPEGLEINSDEDFDKVIEHTIEEGINEYKNSLGETSLQFIDFIEKGGNPADFIESVASVTSISDLDESEPENQRALYREYLKETTKFSDSKIEKLLEQADIDEELEDSAIEAKEYFKAKQIKVQESILKQQEEAYAKAQKDREEFVKTTSKFINESDEIFDFALGDKRKKKELEDYILKPSIPYTTFDGKKVLITPMQADKIKVQSDPENRYKAFIFEALQLKNNFDFKSVKKKGVSEHNQKLKDLAEAHRNKSTIGKLGKTGSKQSGKSSGRFTFETALKDL